MSLARYLRNGLIQVATLSGAALLYRRSRGRQGPLLRVLVFHDVKDSTWFASVIEHLVRSCNVITPEAFRRRDLQMDSVNVLITFDDGYASWVDVCLPILNAHNVKALFFLNSGLLDAKGESEKTLQYLRENLLISPRATLSWEGAEELVKSGHAVGGHTVHHARLSTLDTEVAREEIVDDRERIRAVLGIEPLEFAYPFGGARDYTDMTKTLVKDAGYERAFTTKGTFADVEDQFSLSRMCLEEGMSTSELDRWIGGGYDLYRNLKELCVR